MRSDGRRASQALALLLLFASVGSAGRAEVGPAPSDRAAQAAATVEQPPRSPDEFVPVTELPPEEQLPAAPLLVGAYAVAWLAVLLYVWSLWRRLGRVQQELREVRGVVERREPR